MFGRAAFLILFFALASAATAADDVYVRINQIGYRPSDIKVAIAMGRKALPGRFQIIDAKSNETVFEGQPRPMEQTWGAFGHHAELDFSAVAKEGQYFVRLGELESPKFQIQNGAYADLPDQLLEFMRQQRCGYNPWVDSVCHSFDGRTVDGPLPAGSYVDARGGWHDAGDQLKYLLTASNATAQMLLAYQLGTQAKPQAEFGDRVNELGQPVPNGIPDLLDEARWGLDWMLRLHPAPDQLYHQVADDRDHSTGFRLPQYETVDYGWGAGSYRPVYSADGKPQGLLQYKSESNGIANLAGRYAAAMALAYQIWNDDSQMRPYAARCLAAGKEVYAMGKSHEGVQQGNSYKAPYRYAETTWADDMEWGAAELLRATGESQYRTDAIRYAALAGTDGWFGQKKIGHYQYYPFMNVGHFRLYDLVHKDFREKLAGYYRTEIELCAKASAGNPYRFGVPFIWCSNNLTVALATQSALYERMTGDRRYRAFAANHRDWLVGRNPWGFSMFTQIPADGRFPHDVHLFGSAVLKKSVRGGLVDGPVARSVFGSLKGVSIREPDPLAAFQDERAVYHDGIHDYSTNEPTMDGTASAILMWAVMARDSRYPAAWWAPTSKDGAPGWEILPQEAGPGEVILSKRNELGVLSNFAATPFEFRGKRYASLEGFWQMMKYPEGPDDPRAKFPGLNWAYTRDQVAQLTAFDAKKAGDLASHNMEAMGIDWVTFEGKQMPYKPAEPGEHYRLIVEATQEKVRQNPEVMRVLLATGDLVLRPDHHQEPNAPAAWRYYEILTKIRDDLRSKAGGTARMNQ